jgi:hypothetical protein
MRPGTKRTRDRSAWLTLGLVILSVALLLSLVGCASRSSRLTPMEPETRGDALVALAVDPVPQPAANPDLLKVCAKVPEEDLREMRGCLGVYYFDFTFNVNMLANPEVTVDTNFTAAVPDGAPSPSFNGTTAVFKDDNVLYMAGPTSGGGWLSNVIVTGNDLAVLSNVNFNIQLNDTIFSPSINVLPAGSLTGIGVK